MKRLILYTVFCLWAWGCTRPSILLDEDARKMANAPIAGVATCDFQQDLAYRTFYTSFKDSAEITYYIANFPAMVDSSVIAKQIAAAFKQWQFHVNKPIRRLHQPENADLQIRFEYMDGIGGVLGQSNMPHTEEYRLTNVEFDRYDVQPKEAGRASKYPFPEIALHEFGHALGLLHSENEEAIMYPYFREAAKLLAADDIAGIRMLYHNYEGYNVGKHKYIYLRCDTTYKVGTYFTNKELHSKCKGVNGHYIDSLLVVALDCIRDYYDTPIQVISSYRHKACNDAAGGVPRSTHLTQNAVDFKFINDTKRRTEQYRYAIRYKSSPLPELLQIGVRGVGIYATSAHIDTRDIAIGNAKWNAYSLIWWGVRKKENGILDAEQCGEELVNQ